MNKNQILIFLAGIHSLGFAVFHIGFWKLFKWRTDLKNCSRINRAILQIANLRIIYIFFAVAGACFFYPNDLLSTRLGHVFLGGMSLFWVGRLIEQLIFLRSNRLLIHLFNVLFLLGVLLFALPLYS